MFLRLILFYVSAYGAKPLSRIFKGGSPLTFKCSDRKIYNLMIVIQEMMCYSTIVLWYRMKRERK